MPATHPGQYTTYIPNHEATDGMIVTYSRNPDTFKCGQYGQYKTVTENKGFWMRIDYDNAGRLDDDGQQELWPDGSPRPSHNGETNKHEWLGYKTQRREFGFNLGDLAVSQASWDVVDNHTRTDSQRCMTRRTRKAVDVLANPANYLPTHQFTAVENLSPQIAGKLDLSTTTRADVKKTFNLMGNIIRKKTLGAISQSQMMVVVSPEWAQAVSASPEIHEYVMQQEKAQKLITDDFGNVNDFGLPEKLYGYKIVIEDAVQIRQRRGQASNPEDIWPTDTIVMCSRPGGLQAPEGPSHSSLTCFLKEEMTVESQDDNWNRRHLGSIVDDYEWQLTSPDATVIVQDTLSF